MGSSLAQIRKTKGFSYWAYLCLIATAFIEFIFYLLMGLNARLGLSAINPYIQPILTVILIVFSVKQWKSMLSIWDVVFFISVVSFFCYSPRIYPGTDYLISEYGGRFLFQAFPFFLLGATFNIKELDNAIVSISRLGVSIIGLLIIFSMSGSISFLEIGDDESMGIAYMLLPVLVIVIWHVLLNPNTFDFLLSCFGVFVLLGLGSRGPALCVIFFIVVFFLFFKHFKNELLLKGLLIILSFVCFLFLDSILAVIGSILESIGLSGRVLESISGNSFFSTDTRDFIFAKVLLAISNNGLWEGSGFFADRELFDTANSYTDEIYAHNIFLEVILNFGIIIGIVFFILFFFFLIRSLIICKDSKYSSFLFAFFCAGFVPLLFSGSYLYSSMLWLLVGLFSAYTKLFSNSKT